MGFLKGLENRGFTQQISDPALYDLLDKEKVMCYAGFDPSDSSLHLGHLIPIIGLMQFQRAGHRPIAVVGGATGMIGDPSGKDQERNLLTIDVIRKNEVGIREQLSRFLDFNSTENPAILVNNYDWTHPFGYLEFLRDVGKHFSVNTMISKESVKKRLESRDQGISYTEFSYQILQAYDFHHLSKTYGCRVQIGGSDQWGNITAGIDLNHRMGGEQLYGITFPLLMTAAGKKFGKSEGNAVWLDGERTRPYDFYQYLFQTDDRDVERFLKIFTLLPDEEIQELAACVVSDPEKREAQRRLAFEVTRMVHGEAGVRAAEGATRILFGSESISGYDDATLAAIFADAPSVDIPREHLSRGIALLDLLPMTELCKSKGEARRLVGSGGLYCNNNRETQLEKIITTDDLASPSFLVLRSGKKNYFLVRFTG